MELRQLKYFLAVADARSFVSAANKLFISRQAVSKAISHLESELNTELFMRDSSGAFLTPAGIMFYDRVRSSVMELERAQEEMQRYGGRYFQNIRILFSTGTVRLYESELISFRNSQTNLSVHYSEQPEEYCLRMLTEHKADLAVCMEKPSDSAFQVDELLHSPYGLLIGSGDSLPMDETPDFSDLKWLPLAGFRDSQTRALFEAHQLQPAYSGIDTYRLFSLTMAGKCAMLIPRAMMPRDLPGLRWLPVKNAEQWRLYRVSLHTLESNILFGTVLDDLQISIFDKISKRNSREND